MRSVVAINRSKRLVAFDDGCTLPITSFFDEWNEELLDHDGAVACIAGPDDRGLWWSIDLTAFAHRVYH